MQAQSLSNLEATAVHARLRCSPTHGTEHALSEPFMAQNVHNPWALNAGCGKNTTVLDDSFVVVSRNASIALCSATSLACPLTNATVEARVLEICHPYAVAMAECLFQVSTVQLGMRVFTPLPVSWSPHPMCNRTVQQECRVHEHLARGRNSSELRELIRG